MKKLVVASLIILLLSISIVIAAANANPFPPKKSYISITSPQPYTNFIYQNTTLPLTISLNLLVDDTSGAVPEVTHVTYSLDGQANVTLSDIPKSGREYTVEDSFGGLHQEANYVAITVEAGTLSGLSDGKHIVDVYSFDADGGVLSASVAFEVLTAYKIPEVTLISPQNQTYTAAEIPLTFIVSGEYEQLCYAIDYLRTSLNISIAGNTTVNLSGLQNGYHELRVYANTPGHYGGLASTYFMVNIDANSVDGSIATISPDISPTVAPTESTQVNLQTELDPNQAILIGVVSVAIILAVALGSLAYFKRTRAR
ncbi:MAG: hypothetical protein NWE92_03665 [Candidatus Bathyarchaeota archaeon]|nr:hypothetical protein [Candidatus Bathyarchaeota archaeon]